MGHRQTEYVHMLPESMHFPSSDIKLCSGNDTLPKQGLEMMNYHYGMIKKVSVTTLQKGVYGDECDYKPCTSKHWQKVDVLLRF